LIKSGHPIYCGFNYPLNIRFQEFFDFFFCGISQLPAVPFEALAQDPPAAGFISRNNPAKNNLVIGEKIDMLNPFKTYFFFFS
jgi:hypothetical protein